MLIGERLNAQGSKKMKELLLAEDYEGIAALGREQIEGGAHTLDICVAMTERRDEAYLMSRVVAKLSQAVEAPLVIDTTEADVLEAALQAAPGRVIVNAVNMENGRRRLDAMLPLIRDHGAATIALTIDEVGMARTAERKLEVARKIFDIATGEYGILPDALIFDALTFTLATGDPETADSAAQTLEGIRRIKAAMPGVLASLGVSNVSYGFKPAARWVLNSVFLYHAVQAGLDMVIVNPKQITPYADIPDAQRELAEDLLFNRRPDATARFIGFYEGAKSKQAAADPTAGMSPAERLHWRILHRVPEGAAADVDALVVAGVRERAGVGDFTADPGYRFPNADTSAVAVRVLNEVLLPAMKEVGDRFGSGELILPFVLQSAEVMKRTVSHLERYLERAGGVSKGRIVLATVYGDVHDIGKNLIKTILANNGYSVEDLGKQVPVDTIVDRAAALGADSIGLSALLVSTSRQMPHCVQELARRGLSIPVIIGGAAINRKFGYRALLLEDGTPYAGGVYYAKDAFEGLEVVEQLVVPEKKARLAAAVREKALAARNAPAAAPAPAGPAPAAGSGARPAERIPAPPFLGARVVPAGEIALPDLFAHLDLPELFKLQWGVRSRDKAEYERMVAEEFGPRLEALKAEAAAAGWLAPRVVYGYWRCHAEGNDLVIEDPARPGAELARLAFPRQPDERRLCLADWFRREPGSDVVAFQVVTVGSEASHLAETWNRKGDYARSLYLHGLAVESAEALAELWHQRIRAELGLAPGQGKRYSPGYPAWPRLEDQRLLWKLLDPARIGVSLTEADQMDPEASTSAVVLHHPDAVYYTVRGAEPG